MSEQQWGKVWDNQTESLRNILEQKSGSKIYKVMEVQALLCSSESWDHTDKTGSYT
jgi:hypothetical protein